MRVAVLVVFLADEGTLFCEQLDDGAVGIEDMLAHQIRQPDFVSEVSSVVDRGQEPEVVLLTGVVVIGPVSGSDVNGSGAGLGGDKIGHDHLGMAIEERMLGGGPGEDLTFELGELADGGESGLGGEGPE